MPDMLKRDIGLLQLLQESYAGWTRDPPVTKGAIGSDPGSWPEIAAYVRDSGTNAFVRTLVGAIGELHGLGREGITERNWADLDARIRKCNRDPSWSARVLDRIQVEKVISDPYVDPFMDVRETLGARYCSVLRVNAFAVAWHPESRDHNGNSAWEMLARRGVQPRSFQDFLHSFDFLLDSLPGLHKVGLKNALAYDRSVNFDDGDEELAQSAWGKCNPNEPEKKAFGDVVIDRFCRLAGERGIPFQMHLGTGRVRTSRPLNAAGLIERNPRTRFLLMHLGYPWADELLGMAFAYRNIWIDLTWSWLLSPNRFADSFRQAVDVLPDESRMMLGGDTWHVEETYGALGLARRLIGETLEQCVHAGQFRFAEAERLARKIFHDNAARFFALGDERHQG